MNQKSFLIAVCVLVARLLSPAALQACAVCLTGAADDPVSNAYNWSVLFLMAMPYAVLGSIAGWLFYAHRRAAGKRGGTGNKAPVLKLWLQKESGR